MVLIVIRVEYAAYCPNRCPGALHHIIGRGEVVRGEKLFQEMHLFMTVPIRPIRTAEPARHTVGARAVLRLFKKTVSKSHITSSDE